MCDRHIEMENNYEDSVTVTTVNYGTEAKLMLEAFMAFQGYTGMAKVIDFLKGVS